MDDFVSEINQSLKNRHSLREQARVKNIATTVNQLKGKLVESGEMARRRRVARTDVLTATLKYMEKLEERAAKLQGSDPCPIHPLEPELLTDETESDCSNQMELPAVIFALDGTVLFLNTAFIELAGLGPERLKPERPLILYDLGDIVDVGYIQSLMNMTRTCMVGRYPLSFVTAKGVTWTEVELRFRFDNTFALTVMDLR
jgi:hypothetical protein